MTDQAQLITQLRFGIEQLSERNAQHEWEHLCRHFARMRICSNLLPATGPVQAGGDQGRDFETFRTYLGRSPLKGRSFVGLISEKPLAFACTLEAKRGLASKVRRDVETICSSGTSIEGIYMFCSRDLDISKRHQLQEWALGTYNIVLEILDGAAIAELLCNRELFWLAERYLQIPSELLPTISPAEEQDWYSRTLHKWQHETQPGRTFADFSEIRVAARDALGPFAYDSDGGPFARYTRAELPFWIEQLDMLAEHSSFNLLRRKAFYEASVLRLRGLGSLFGQEERLRLYFAEIPLLQDTNELTDANTLLTYLLPANELRTANLQDSEIATWRRALEQQVGVRLREAKRLGKMNERCALLEIRGYLALFSRYAERMINVTQALNHWSKLAKLVARAPLFPLEEFADLLSQSASFIGSHPNYEPLTETVDALVAKRFGAFKTAEKCLNRATAFREAGDLPRAMAQLHRAKVDWFAEETLEKCLLALHWLSHGYEEQGLHFAAKYYALSAAYLALFATDLRLKTLIARSLVQAAEQDYLMGAWHGFLELTEAAASVYPHFAHEPDADFNESHGILQHLVFYLSLLPVITKKLHPALETFAVQKSSSVIERLDLADVLEELQPTIEATWGGEDAQTLQETIEEQLAGPAWSDAGAIRRTQWKAHGVTWSVEWRNEYKTTMVVEEFLATLQIFLSDLANYDLCLLRSTVHATIKIASGSSGSSHGFKGFDTRFEPSNAQRSAIIMLPPYQSFRDGRLSREDIDVGILGVINSLLCEISLLPYDRFYKILNERFSQGLKNKLLIGTSYNECLRVFVAEERFEKSQRWSKAPIVLPAPFTSRLPEALAWVAGPGPGYTPEAAEEQIKNRYRAFALPIGRTLQRLVRARGFQEAVSNLRADGWKDWHILGAIFNITLNYRLNHRSIGSLTPQSAKAYIKHITSNPEPDDALEVPLEEFDEAKLRQTIPIYMMSCLQTYGLELHQLTPDLAGVEDFLAHRYNFWTDDAEHEELFVIKRE